MNLEEYIANQELALLTDAWRRLTWWQKKMIVLSTFPALSLRALDAHIARRRAQFTPSAHWVGR